MAELMFAGRVTAPGARTDREMRSSGRVFTDLDFHRTLGAACEAII